MTLWPLLLVALLMLALCVIIISWPRKANAANNQTPLQLFEERLQLLALARDSGELAEQDFASAAAELKQQFNQQQQQTISFRQPKHQLLWHLALVALVFVVVALTYRFNGHYQQLADWQLAKTELASYGERALLGQGEPLSEHETRLFALALRTKLAVDGDDAVAWMLLGRIWMSQGLMEDAIEAFEKSLALSPNRIPLLLNYSQALIVVGGDENLGRAGRAVARVLLTEPDNLDAMSLMALIAHDKGDTAEAIKAWSLLAEQLEQDDPRYPLVLSKLSELGADTIATIGRQIRVRLTVAHQLAAANPDASLFLFARAVGGSNLPLAVQRIPLPSGEVELLLDEKMAMQPEWSLARAEQVIVVARMSQAGTVEQMPGDLQVESDILTFNEAKISVALTLEP
ncbi:c-type cytochrome biogenesis protein CcmI [Arsukibacterium sp. UBA3155]|uniref:c-type cytochrome biogenesis protein CcmI n=1 Tax=Arsukibacterium sp. UBA3155 TaxID=1946058 RepID=UPI0025BB1C84|nr:c-type cytochrome biogenesis protein CcmI [Arsukibacterium sp. UBA3155]|tara:strand:- start:147254 stop:148459 length:1206 start_codon:yes stop_codon:yes gene_type:complete